MNFRNTYKHISLSLITSLVLIGCNSTIDNNLEENTLNTNTNTKEQVVLGAIFKGPIDQAKIVLTDMNDKIITQSNSSKGLFDFPKLVLESDYYILASNSGSYEDEATKTTVTLNNSQGLKTLLSKAELQKMIDNKSMIAMTPETTLYTDTIMALMKNKSKSLVQAQDLAKQLIHHALIQNSSPMPNLDGDVFLMEGNLTSPFPKDAKEAFGRNRAISFSYMVKNLGLAPEKVFEVLDLLSADYGDGVVDGIAIDGEDVNISQVFALARTELFQNTVTKLQAGELSAGQKSSLESMGFDVKKFEQSLSDDQKSLEGEVSKYLVSTSLPTLHILPTMSDEDNNLTDMKATYTLTANTNVNVNIQTPMGAWTTPMWRYNNSALPLVIRTKRGTKMTLNLKNKLNADSTIHWHGFKIPADMDGGPDIPVAKDMSKAYSFTMNQPASSLWFHPHPDMETGKQVYMGLAGVFLIEDDISQKLESDKMLPSGNKDTVLLVQDRRFDANTTSSDTVRNLAYKTMDMDSDGMLGDTILVNGSVVPKQSVSNTLHRYRLYNVSNARTYKFALSDGSTFKVVGTDGGLLAEPTQVSEIMLGAAERVEIIIDFSKYSKDDKVMLVSQAFTPDMMSMMDMGSMGGGMGDTGSMGSGMGDTGSMGSGMGDTGSMGSGMGDTGSMGSGMGDTGAGSMDGMLANGKGLSIMRFDIDTIEDEDITLYTSLPTNAEIHTRLSEADATNSTVREFVMSMGGMGGNGGMGSTNTSTDSNTSGMQGMSFVINGKAFDPKRVDEFVNPGAIETWSIKNMSPMAHPFHAHAIQYQILSRNGVPATGTDLGWKDTFLVQPGQTIKIMAKFEAINTGDYMYHCHILEHEDAGMMGYFRVGDTGQLGVQ